MAKRDRRGTVFAKSKARRVKKKATGRRPAKSMGAGPHQAKQRPARTPDSGLAGPNRAPRHSVVSRQRKQSDAPVAGASTQRTGTAKLLPTSSRPPARSVAGLAVRGRQSAKEFRTPLPPPIIGELEEINLLGGRPDRRRATARPRTISAQSDAAGPTQRSGAGGRTRTPRPLLTPGELEEIDLFGGRARKNKKIRQLADKGSRFQHIQDFLHNPNQFELRGKELGTSSTVEEVEARTGEVRYQIEVLRSLLSVLTEELDALERARPQSSVDQPQVAQS
jgi:hypothetical protein